MTEAPNIRPSTRIRLSRVESKSMRPASRRGGRALGRRGLTSSAAFAWDLGVFFTLHLILFMRYDKLHIRSFSLLASERQSSSPRLLFTNKLLDWLRAVTLSTNQWRVWQLIDSPLFSLPWLRCSADPIIYYVVRNSCSFTQRGLIWCISKCLLCFIEDSMFIIITSICIIIGRLSGLMIFKWYSAI